MAVSDVYGLNRFSEYMKGLEDCYTVIGGAACDVILSNADLGFRATKDIDVILLIEDRLPDVASAVWRLIKDGSYEYGQKGSEGVHFYRFAKPREDGFPSMVELFSKAPSFIEKPDGLAVVPLPAGDDVSSLSAILLNEDYYNYMKSGRKTVDGISVLDEAHLIPFKAKAFLDLSERRARGEKVDSSNIKKHKKDVFRLAQLFTPSTSSTLPESIHNDMVEFCRKVKTEGVPLKQMGIPMTLEEALELIRNVYGL